MQDIQTGGGDRYYVPNRKSNNGGLDLRNEVLHFETRNDKQLNRGSGGRGFLLLGFFLTIISLTAFVLLASFVFDSATITIRPIQKEVPLNDNFVVDPAERDQYVNINNESVSENITLPKGAFKSVSRRATGKITIMNNFGIQSQKLLKNTRFTSPDGKVYRLNDGVTVPGKTAAGPGKITADVTADTEGEQYNIGPTKFTIPGFKGSNKYTAFMGESALAMSGGASGKEAGVSDIEIEKGKATIKEKIKNLAVEKFSKDVPVGFVFNKETLIITYSPMVRKSETEDTAVYEMNATVTVAYIKKDEIVKKLIEKNSEVSSVSGASIEVKEANNFNLTISDTSAIEDATKPINLNVIGTTRVVFHPNKNNIINYFAGKNRSEFEESIKRFEFVAGAEMVIRPIWANNFPKDVSKINVEEE